MPAPSNPNRRPDIQAALKRATPKDTLSLGALAEVWGTAKSRFTSVKNVMPGFPAPKTIDNEHFYPARKALKAMLDYETRNDQVAAARANRQAQILGGLSKQRAGRAVDAGIPARDLILLSRLQAETEQRERDQRLYIPAAEVALVAGEVFGGLSEFMAGLSNKIDPNGLLDPLLREQIDQHGADALLDFHRQMKNILDADAIEGTPRGSPGRARPARARRKRT